jgi:hypothetical protein
MYSLLKARKPFTVVNNSICKQSFHYTLTLLVMHFCLFYGTPETLLLLAGVCDEFEVKTNPDPMTLHCTLMTGIMLVCELKIKSF